MGGEGFLTNIATAELFFRICARYNITDKKDRLELLRLIVAKKKAKYVRDIDEFIQDKKVLKIDLEGKKEEDNL